MIAFITNWISFVYKIRYARNIRPSLSIAKNTYVDLAKQFPDQVQVVFGLGPLLPLGPGPAIVPRRPLKAIISGPGPAPVIGPGPKRQRPQSRVCKQNVYIGSLMKTRHPKRHFCPKSWPGLQPRRTECRFCENAASPGLGQEKTLRQRKNCPQSTRQQPRPYCASATRRSRASEGSASFSSTVLSRSRR